MKFLQLFVYSLLAVVGYGAMLIIGCLTILIGTPLLRGLAFLQTSAAQRAAAVRLAHLQTLRSHQSTQY